MSGFWGTTPPVLVRLPGTISLPAVSRRIRRGPSEEKSSLALAEVKTPGYGPLGLIPSKEAAAGVAATLKAAVAALWPRVAPLVGSVESSSPRKAIRLNSGTLDVAPAANL